MSAVPQAVIYPLGYSPPIPPCFHTQLDPLPALGAALAQPAAPDRAAPQAAPNSRSAASAAAAKGSGPRETRRTLGQRNANAIFGVTRKRCSRRSISALHLPAASAESGAQRHVGAQERPADKRGRPAARGLRPRTNPCSPPPEGPPERRPPQPSDVRGRAAPLSPRRRHAEAQQGGQAAAAAALQGRSVRHPLGLHPGRALPRSVTAGAGVQRPALHGCGPAPVPGRGTRSGRPGASGRGEGGGAGGRVRGRGNLPRAVLSAHAPLRSGGGREGGWCGGPVG